MTKIEINMLLQEIKKLRRIDRRDAAIDLLNKALQENADARLFHSRAMTFEQMEQPEKAVQDLTSAILLDKTNPKYYFDRGQLLSAPPLGRNEEATHDFEEALRLDPNHVMAHCLYCASLLIMGRPNRALEHAEAAVRLAPHEANAHFFLGETYMSLKRYKEAVELFRKAVELDPAPEEYSSSLCRAVKRYSEAETDTRRENHSE